MYRNYSLCRTLLLVVAGCHLTFTVAAWDALTSDLDIQCNQQDTVLLDCHYRLLFPGSVNSIRASSGDLELPVTKSAHTENDTSAIFFLVDTSDPGRQDVIEKNIQQIERLLTASGPNHRIGLATFDNKLRILAPVGSSNSQIVAAIKDVRAEGRTTELYRSLLLTIEKLSRTEAASKAIYLFSDGQAEDRAYFRADVVKAARNKRVIINSIGFPRSIALSVALQTLRRLSEETGGIFTEADRNFDLDDRFYRQPYALVDAADSFNVDLSALANAGKPLGDHVALVFASDIGNIETRVPVSLPVAQAPRPGGTRPAAVPPPESYQPRIKVVAPVIEPEKINFWLWYGLPVALVLLFSISLVTLILTYKKQVRDNSVTEIAPAPNKPFAYLVSQEEDSKRYPITSTTWRIGRSKDNELPLDDNSVSRLHAEIHRYNNGSFFLLDMQSLNGVYVNGEQVSNRKLQEGDIIEIGDVYFRFTQFAEDYLSDDDTAIQITRTPAK